MNHKTVNGWVLLSLLMSTLVYAYPQQPQQQAQPSQIAQQYIPKTAQQQADYQQHQYLRQIQPQPQVPHYQVHAPAQWQHPQQQPQQQQFRKYAEKPNHLKKVSLDDIDEDNQMNQIDSNAFSWTNMLGQVMQMMFANANNFAPPTKSDDLDGGGNSVAPSWTNVLSAGMYTILDLLEPISFLYSIAHNNAIEIPVLLYVVALRHSEIEKKERKKKTTVLPYRRTSHHDIETGSKVIPTAHTLLCE